MHGGQYSKNNPKVSPIFYNKILHFFTDWNCDKCDATTDVCVTNRDASICVRRRLGDADELTRCWGLCDANQMCIAFGPNVLR